MKKLYFITATLLIFALIISLIIWHESYSLALIREGLNPKDVFTIEHSFDSNKKEFKVIKTSSKDNKNKLAILTKNNLGMWNISSTSEDARETPSLIRIGWIRGAGARRYEYSENASFENEWHIAYYGNNATKLIEFLPGQIPENVTVNIRQAGKEFWIHMVSFAEPNALNNVDIDEILVKNQCISSHK